jgi:hypothetical protein
VVGLALTVHGFYRLGHDRGAAAEHMRAHYIFAAAREVVSGGALRIVTERLFGNDRDNAWMQDELRNYIEEKEARRRDRES